jgi:Flp pilus assembly CpaF family ATPase
MRLGLASAKEDMCQEPNISFDAGKLQTGLEVIANQLGKKLDEDNPLLHAQLPDGSRLAAVIPPVVRCTPRSSSGNSPAAITQLMI